VQVVLLVVVPMLIILQGGAAVWYLRSVISGNNFVSIGYWLHSITMNNTDTIESIETIDFAIFSFRRSISTFGITLLILMQYSERGEAVHLMVVMYMITVISWDTSITVSMGKAAISIVGGVETGGRGRWGWTASVSHYDDDSTDDYTSTSNTHSCNDAHISLTLHQLAKARPIPRQMDLN